MSGEDLRNQNHHTQLVALKWCSSFGKTHSSSEGYTSHITVPFPGVDARELKTYVTCMSPCTQWASKPRSPPRGGWVDRKEVVCLTWNITHQCKGKGMETTTIWMKQENSMLSEWRGHEDPICEISLTEEAQNRYSYRAVFKGLEGNGEWWLMGWRKWLQGNGNVLKQHVMVALLGCNYVKQTLPMWVVWIPA